MATRKVLREDLDDVRKLIERSGVERIKSIVEDPDDAGRFVVTTEPQEPRRETR